MAACRLIEVSVEAAGAGVKLAVCRIVIDAAERNRLRIRLRSGGICAATVTQIEPVNR